MTKRKYIPWSPAEEEELEEWIERWTKQNPALTWADLGGKYTQEKKCKRTGEGLRSKLSQLRRGIKRHRAIRRHEQDQQSRLDLMSVRIPSPPPFQRTKYPYQILVQPSQRPHQTTCQAPCQDGQSTLDVTSIRIPSPPPFQRTEYRHGIFVQPSQGGQSTLDFKSIRIPSPPPFQHTEYRHGIFVQPSQDGQSTLDLTSIRIPSPPPLQATQGQSASNPFSKLYRFPRSLFDLSFQTLRFKKNISSH